VQQAKSVVVVRGNTTNFAIEATPKGYFGWTLNDELIMPWFTNVGASHSLQALVLSSTFPGRPLSTCRHNKTARIGVLNRKGSRELVNHKEIVSQLEALDSVQVRYQTFEGVSFEDQVDFFSSHDIVVSPHGAQLTGVWLMPTCGSVLELLPSHYHCHFFFGSLSAGANLTSAYIYLSDGDPAQEIKNISQASFRAKARSIKLCPPVSSVVLGAQELIHKWKSCCANLQN
jgi:hypothetical protein